MPLIAVQILWVNLVTNGIQDIALAFEAGEPGAMQKPPRNPKEKIFDRLMMKQTLVSSLTMAIIGFILWWYLINVLAIDITVARNYILLLFF